MFPPMRRHDDCCTTVQTQTLLRRGAAGYLFLRRGGGADSPGQPSRAALRKRALHFDETTRSRGRDATTVDSILEILARLLEQRRGARLARRKLDSGEYSGVIHPLNQDRPSP